MRISQLQARSLSPRSEGPDHERRLQPEPPFPARRLLSDVVVPNARVVTILVIVLQVIVAILILSRGDLVKLALIVGGTFALAVAVVSSPGGTIGNLVLAGIQFTLVFAR